MEIKEPYKHKERYNNWLKEKKLKGLNKTNQRIVLKFMEDMALGLNVSGSKGSRSATRLNTLRTRLSFVISKLQDRGVKDIKKATAKDLHTLFNDMRTGVLKTKTGTAYKSTGDYIKVFKTFWHWYQKVSKDKIEDITSDLDTRGEKPKFIYFDENQFQRILNKAKYDLKPVLCLAFDSGMRVTELVNIKVSDFSNDYKELNIRDETSKTFGRKIKLMLCPNQVREYVNKLGLKANDYLVQQHPSMINKELREIGKEVLSTEQTKHKNLTLYDFRHSSACYWLPRYKSESALKYRFGWKKSDMIHYYTEFLGMKDTITRDDLYIDVTKDELQKQLEMLKKDNRAKAEIITKVLNRLEEIEKRQGKPLPKRN